MDELIGVIKIFAGTFIPQGYLACNGQLLQIRQYNALFSLLGTTYGGDGQTTFALPNLQSRIPIGMGQGAGLSLYTQGQIGGVQNVTLMISQMPMHAHPVVGNAPVQIPCNANSANSDTPEGAYMAPSSSQIYNESTGGAVMAGGSAAININSAPVGGNQPFPIMNPYIAVNYIICVEGIYPTRN